MILIGEKLNGSIPAVKDAIARRDASFIEQRARMQADAGADYIDVCASVEEAQEVETLRWMIELVQGVTDIPLSVDSPSPRVIAEVLPACKRPGIINSVSMEGEKTSVLFPIISETKWKCIALLCDDRGIPATVEKRMDVCRRILSEAARCHVEQSRLFFDPLVIALATDGETLTKFSACCREIRALAPDAHITSGLSNISFGLPARKYINMTFLALARGAGMDSAILDPTKPEILGTVYAAEALLENDEYCLDYITAFREGLLGTEK